MQTFELHNLLKTYLDPTKTQDEQGYTLCQPNIRFRWNSVLEHSDEKTSFSTRIEPKVYENELLSFLEPDGVNSNAKTGEIRLLIGGWGSGKSTFLNYIIEKLPKRNIAFRIPEFFHFSFRDWTQHDTENSRDDEQVFWRHLAATLVSNKNTKLSIFEEATDFWSWCEKTPIVKKQRTWLITFLSNYAQECDALFPNEADRSEESRDFLRFVIQARKELVARFEEDAEALCWYEICKIAYLVSEKQKHKMAYFIFDDFDHIPPKFQREISDVSIKLASVIRCKILIPMRPVTYKSCDYGVKLVRSTDHCVPSATTLIKRRLADLRIAHDLSDQNLRTLNDIETAFLRDGTAVSNLIEATSGLSMRLALTNLFNCVASDSFTRHLNSGGSFSDLHQSKRAEMFLCSNNPAVHSTWFHNLYRIDDNPQYNLLKLRCLEYLCSTSQTTLSMLYNRCLRRFGYSNELIVSTLNKMLLQRCALIWCEDMETVEERDLTLHSRVAVTPLGEKYWKDCFGDLLYDDTALRSSVSETLSPESRAIQYHYLISDVELREIKHCVDEFGSEAYLEHYGNNGHPSFAERHFQKVSAILESRRYHGIEVEEFVSSERTNFIRRQINDIIMADRFS